MYLFHPDISNKPLGSLTISDLTSSFLWAAMFLGWFYLFLNPSDDPDVRKLWGTMSGLEGDRGSNGSRMIKDVIMREMADRDQLFWTPGRHRLATGSSGFYVVSSRSGKPGMSSPNQTERERGTKEARQQLVALREKWPLAFPVKDEEVRPLAIGTPREIAAAMGWSVPYTLGVLGRWKMAPAYCQAVLSYDQRVTLDGVPAEAVDGEAKDLAAKQLGRLAARKAGKKAASAAPAEVKPKPIPTQSEMTPEQLRARVRAGLLRRRA